jgi:hypothetical protein
MPSQCDDRGTHSSASQQLTTGRSGPRPRATPEPGRHAAHYGLIRPNTKPAEQARHPADAGSPHGCCGASAAHALEPETSRSHQAATDDQLRLPLIRELAALHSALSTQALTVVPSTSARA